MIDKIQSLSPMMNLQAGAIDSESPKISFSDVLGSTLDKVAEMEVQSSKTGQLAAAGLGADLHSVMIAGEKSTLALQLTMQVRNKVIEAYQEIMRTQM